MFDRVTNRIGISITLFLVIAYLAWTNYKSLIFLTNSSQLEELLFCGVGALAFSMVTVMVMRNTRAKIALFTFPLFDVAFVFFGSNIHHAQMLADEPVRFWLSVVVALFTGVTIFSLSLIKAGDHIPDIGKKVSESDERYNLLLGEYKSLQSDFTTKQSELVKIRGDCEVMQNENTNLKTKFKSLETNFDKVAGECSKYKAVYLSAERSRILKKNEANRTTEEKMLLDTFN